MTLRRMKLARALRESNLVVIIGAVPHAPCVSTARDSRHVRQSWRSPQLATVRQVERHERGQVAQVVERSPEKAGVGGSTPSLATTFSITSTSTSRKLGCNWVQ